MTLSTREAEIVLDRDFLELRHQILGVAATLDRIDRADGSVKGDPRMECVRRAFEILRSDDPGRAERIQMAFSREYEASWRA